MPIPLYQVDAFTAEAFCGNPAGVVILPEKMPDGWMQAVAKEMNLSETAFLLREFRMALVCAGSPRKWK